MAITTKRPSLSRRGRRSAGGRRIAAGRFRAQFSPRFTGFVAQVADKGFRQFLAEKWAEEIPGSFWAVVISSDNISQMPAQFQQIIKRYGETRAFPEGQPPKPAGIKFKRADLVSGKITPYQTSYREASERSAAENGAGFTLDKAGLEGLAASIWENNRSAVEEVPQPGDSAKEEKSKLGKTRTNILSTIQKFVRALWGSPGEKVIRKNKSALTGFVTGLIVPEIAEDESDEALRVRAPAYWSMSREDREQIAKIGDAIALQLRQYIISNPTEFKDLTRDMGLTTSGPET